MFVQVIMGQVEDRDGLRRQLERWRSDLQPGADGWLGSTGGVADDGTCALFVRFASEEAARANSDRPEQGAWWQETAPCFAGEPSFLEGTEVDLILGGGSDDAGFVQVIQGQGDRAALNGVDEVLTRLAPEHRPEIIGGVRLWPGDGTFTEAVYFTSEDEARIGEAKEPPAEVAEAMATFQANLGNPRFVDLRDPWIFSA